MSHMFLHDFYVFLNNFVLLCWRWWYYLKVVPSASNPDCRPTQFVQSRHTRKYKQNAGMLGHFLKTLYKTYQIGISWILLGCWTPIFIRFGDQTVNKIPVNPVEKFQSEFDTTLTLRILNSAAKTPRPIDPYINGKRFFRTITFICTEKKNELVSPATP